MGKRDVIRILVFLQITLIIALIYLVKSYA
ncbi:hypothetical protein UFOVP333_14 [uncultured Caudovirales phage]|uniref:Uncharacterized protein n=1 Tax=uncultured Caudovirales phage TaxID=2100421 RepID=A0A6J5NTT3_9CAUD|nr:hypothetical protein UFOVP333_14 [uncultured Caudovirales phage]CAB4162212.1 hypothetical protein UFOVP792_26 [uncultured Caudovirales phage]